MYFDALLVFLGAQHGGHCELGYSLQVPTLQAYGSAAGGVPRPEQRGDDVLRRGLSRRPVTYPRQGQPALMRKEKVMSLY